MLLLSPLAWAENLDFQPANGQVVHEGRPVVSIGLPGKADYLHSAARMWINGKEVSGSLLRTPSFVSYRPMFDLKKGPIQVRFTIPIVGRDPAELRWTFQLDPRGKVVSFSHDGGEQRLQEYDELKVTMKAESGGEAYFTVGSIGRRQPLTETKDGVYEGTFTVEPGDYAMGAKVKGFYRLGPRQETIEAEDKVIVFGHLFRVKIYEPVDGSEVPTQFQIKGRTRPNSKVTLVPQVGFNNNMDAPNSSNANNPRTSAQAASGSGSIEVEADDKGYFVLDYGVPLRLPNLNVVMSIFAVEPGGERSVPRILRYRF